MDHDERERRYGRDEYYWGTEPNELAVETFEHAVEVTGPAEDLRVLDLGAGEGRDAVYFAEQGCSVLAVDVSPNGLAKATRLAEERGVGVETRVADGNDLELRDPVDVFYSIGAVQYVRPENRARQFGHFAQMTSPGGVHAIFAFVDHPAVPTPPDWTENEYFYDPGELDTYYEGWTVLASRDLVFRDDSGGEPHEHAAEILVAQKPA